nr:hypothetical protein RAR13_04445 [Aminobacter aminovorans]
MQNFYFWSHFSAGMLPAIIACIVGAAAVVRLHSERVETDGVRGLAAIALVCGGSINLSLWTALLALTHVGRLDITLVWVALLAALVGSWYGLAVTRFKAVALAPEVGGAAV